MFGNEVLRKVVEPYSDKTTEERIKQYVLRVFVSVLFTKRYASDGIKMGGECGTFGGKCEAHAGFCVVILAARDHFEDGWMILK
jgi:hypothetical protein